MKCESGTGVGRGVPCSSSQVLQKQAIDRKYHGDDDDSASLSVERNLKSVREVSEEMKGSNETEGSNTWMDDVGRLMGWIVGDDGLVMMFKLCFIGNFPSWLGNVAESTDTIPTAWLLQKVMFLNLESYSMGQQWPENSVSIRSQDSIAELTATIPNGSDVFAFHKLPNGIAVV
ncbi:hypothetical protein FF38_04595 [Lucilia cuprina]|uniref:Uncharacterized protein n=1 Tax=Lucilia cuprina TaxID=7375 RepID=A0A0L0BWD7_LUCCU|nr:hypothetical protein FF38_04595 [Lucilia cuprina]